MGKGWSVTTPLHDRLVQYLTVTGWIAPAEVGEVGGLWRHPQSEYLLPVPNELAADGIDWQVIAERLAIVEESDDSDVLAHAERLGTESILLRLDTYGHLWPDADESTRSAIGAVIAERMDSVESAAD